VKRPDDSRLTARELALLEILRAAVASGRGIDRPGFRDRDFKHYRNRLLRTLRHHGKPRRRAEAP